MTWRHNTHVHLGPDDVVGFSVDRPAVVDLRDYGNEVGLSLRGEDGAVLIRVDRQTWNRYVAPALREPPTPTREELADAIADQSADRLSDNKHAGKPDKTPGN